MGGKPVSRDLFGQRLVGFRDAAGRPVVMDAICWHMGGDLALGQVVNGRIVCPFHGWCFDADGRCDRKSPQAGPVAQRVFATCERAGRVYVYPGQSADFELPFFTGLTEADICFAPAFELEVACPWWLVGTNGFDVQHFAVAHDRRLIEPVRVDSPSRAARRIVSRFEVVESGLRDRLVRWFNGPEVTMDVTSWAGSLVFVVASFKRSTSYGMVEIIPRPGPCADVPAGTLIRIRIGVRRSTPLDLARALIKRHFIRMFLGPDVMLLNQAHYRPDRLGEPDRVMIDYLNWLAGVSQAQTTGLCDGPHP
jgi:phenylpropionate dioxygenase-like ring-hydroxylating dioxygenase large terminal subunit